jgi:hypothetical protein
MASERRQRRRHAVLPLVHSGAGLCSPEERHWTKSRTLVRRAWLPAWCSMRGGGVEMHAGQPAAIRRRQRRVARRPPACASIPHLATRQPARSSVGRERQHGVLALAGAVGAPAAPKGKCDDPAA